MDVVVPWTRLLVLIAPLQPKAGAVCSLATISVNIYSDYGLNLLLSARIATLLFGAVLHLVEAFAYDDSS